MASLSDAIEYPMEDDDWITTILIGGALSIFSFLLVPMFFVYGYIVRVIRYRLNDDPQPPAFDEWGELFMDGLKLFVIGIAYMLIPMIVGFVTVGGSIASMATGSESGAAAGLAGLLFGFVATLVLALVFSYIAAAAVVNFARQNSLGAAFDFGTIKSVVFSSDYAVAWLLAVAVFFGIGIISSVLNVIPFLGAIIGAFIAFYGQMVAAYLYTDGFTAALESGQQDEWGAPQEPAY